MLEPLCAIFQLAAENQTVQAGFVDDGCLALVIRTITLNQGNWFYLAHQRVLTVRSPGFCVAKCYRNNRP